MNKLSIWFNIRLIRIDFIINGGKSFHGKILYSEYREFLKILEMNSKDSSCWYYDKRGKKLSIHLNIHGNQYKRKNIKWDCQIIMKTESKVDTWTINHERLMDNSSIMMKTINWISDH